MANEIEKVNTIAIADIEKINGITDDNLQELNTFEMTGIPPAMAASGGTETTTTVDGVSYKFHTFTSSGTLNITSAGVADILVVAGGGAGGQDCGGGGGGGGMLFNAVTGSASHATSTAAANPFSSTGNKTITIGAGGAQGDSGSAYAGYPGSDSIVYDDSGTATALMAGDGGGGGGKVGRAATYMDGGSGGGGGGNGSGSITAGVTADSGQGNTGGIGFSNHPIHRGGGGGGGAAAGFPWHNNYDPYYVHAQGGAGSDFSGVVGSLGGDSGRFSGGGGASGTNNSGWTALGAAAVGGGGTGGSLVAAGIVGGNGTAGTTNTGGGGGGGGNAGNGGIGGSGIVIIRYPA